MYGHGGHLGHVTWIIYIHIGPLPIDASLIGKAVLEKKIFEKCGRRTMTDDGQTDGRRMPAYPISSHVSLRLM